MASQQYYQPQKGRKDTDDSVYDNPGNAPSIPKGSSQGLAATQSAQASLDDIDDALRDQEQSGGFYKEVGEDGGKKKLSGDELQDAESTKKPDASSEAIASSVDKSNSGRFAKIKARGSKLVKNKTAVAAAGVGGVSAGTIILLIIFALGLFKIPNFAQNLAAYQFARVTRDFAQTQDSINATEMGIDSSDDGVFSQIKTRYSETAVGQVHGKVTDTYSRLMGKYNPNTIIDNMERDGTLRYEYVGKSLSRPNGRLTAVIINGTRVPVKPPTFASTYLPGVQLANDISFSQQFVPEFRSAIASNDIGPIVRGPVQAAMRERLGVRLIAWDVGKYTGKNTEQSEVIVEQDSEEKIKGGDPVENPKLTDKLNETAEEADTAEKAALADPEQAAAVVAAPNELPAGVEKVLDDTFTATSLKATVSGILGKITAFINPIYAVATPLCIIYEGSLTNAGPTIDNQSAQAQRANYLVQSGASQVKDGYKSSGNAAGALGWKLGDIENSNSERRAGGEAVDTHNSFSTQSSPTGAFSITDAILPAPFDALFDNAAKTCPLFTNIWTGVALGAANIVALIASFGAAAPAEGATDVAADAAAQSITSRILEKVVAAKTLGKTVAEDTVKQGALIAGGTFLAKLIVLANIGSQQSALATGTSFDNEVDNGANQNASETEREGMYGRPMTKDEVAMSNMQDQQFLAARTSSQSVIARYLSPSNPDSLITHVASMADTHLGSGNFTSLFNIGSSILNPLNSFSSAIASLTASRVGAATTDTYNYGNVQWGWSPPEEALLAIDAKTNEPTNPSYSILENRLILDQSGKEDEIAAKYGPCFDPDNQMGDLLTNTTGDGGNDNYYIVRDNDGNVSADQGLCSPQNLGINNPTYHDLVFRWRLDHRYNAGLDQYDAEQTLTTSDTTTTSPTDGTGGIGTAADGFTFPLQTTQQALISHNPQWCYQSQTNCHHDFPAADIFTDEGTQVVAAMGGKVITAHQVDTCTTDEGGSTHLQIQGTDGKYYFYTHMEGPLQVRLDQVVKAGDPLGHVGSAVCAQGTTSHLHIQWYTSIINGDAQSMEIQPELVAAFQKLPAQ